MPESQPVNHSWSIVHYTIILIFPSAVCTSNCASLFIFLLVQEQLLTHCLSADTTFSAQPNHCKLRYPIKTRSLTSLTILLWNSVPFQATPSI
jgi:hypothetical protein